ncbi:hypothetical protein ATI61_109373 [Archangium gephyra]|uniref:Uncharacterized protein n=1 Tax=Archangium gephyra TaxID=48 RepID=A0AAC8Q1T5_9BACT|nr:hypothetical protein [Archangium gephyra]AKI99424.1 Hypothetical protein AA314_01051 [Archangium gephyra]REG28029.1 hypothetical protein ATI61_109373 [Archangium gephyra]
MRLALRALLLATGFAVMVATSPAPIPFTISLFVHARGAQTVDFQVKSTDGKRQVKPLLHVDSSAGDGVAPGARLVGILSPEKPPAEAYPQLDPKASFTVGQQLEGLGTVVFVQQLPSSSNPSILEPDPLPLPEHENLFLTVFSPDLNVGVSMNLAVPQMEEQCQCKVAETYPSIVHHYEPPPPDAGTGGRDGG